MGAPGSGKTSTMKELEASNISHYSIGAMYRQLSSENSDLGSEVKSYIDKGQVVPITIAKKVIERFIREGNELIVIDGFPRNMEQALMFEKVIQNNAEFIGVIELIVDEQEALNRITQRARGTDDDPSLFKERMRVYNDEVDEIRAFYQGQNQYFSIESQSDTTETAKELKRIISKGIYEQ